MEWLIIAALGFWLWLQSQRLKTVSDKLDRLEAALERESPETGMSAPAQARARSAEPEPGAEPDLEEFAAPLPVLLLDQPLHRAPEPPDVLELDKIAEAPARRARSGAAEQWLAENGLAWLGGGALALGGAFLVAYAAQSGWFTPAMRLTSALAAGLLMIGASEWVRRANKASAGAHPLVASLLAGAGAASLYAVAWAAHGLYHFIDWGAAALALSVCAALLLGLSMLHGQALGVLAIVAAFIAPLLTSKGAWPESALTLYLVSLVGAGCAAAVLRGWTIAAGAALFCAYLWFSVSLADDAHVRATLLLAGAALGACALALRPARADSADDWRETRAMAPSIGVFVSAALVVFDWAAIVSDADAHPMIAAPALTAIGIAGLAALARRARLIDPLAAAGAIAAMPLGFFIFALLRSMIAPMGQEFLPWALAAAGAAGLAGLFANPTGKGRVLLAVAGAASALAMVVLAVLPHGDWSASAVWAPLIVAALLLGAGALVSAASAADETRDLGVDMWAGAAGAALLLGLNALTPEMAEPIAAAAAALVFALLHIWRGWRAWPIAAASAAAAALAYMLSADVFGAGMADAGALWPALFAIAISALNLSAAAALLRQRGIRSDFADGIGAGGVIACVIGAYLALNWLASGGAGVQLDGFTHHSLNALMLMIAGYLCTPAPDSAAGWITRWRGHVLLGAGFLYVFAIPGMALNPWWGEAPAPLAGVALVNALAIAFAAPALMLGLSARRFYAHTIALARVYAGAAGLLGLFWAALEIRRGFHAPNLFAGGMGLVESHVYALVALAGACALVWRGRSSRSNGARTQRPFTRDVALASNAAAWIGVMCAVFVMLLAGNALWAWRGEVQTGAVSTAIIVALHAAAAIVCFVMGRLVEPSLTRRMCALAASAFAFMFGVLAIRWAHHMSAMADGVPLIGIEGLAYGLWPLVFVHAGAWFSRAAKTESQSSFAADYAMIFARAAWPALMFAALGLWLLYPPWWGWAPAQMATPALALAGLGIYFAAAWLSARSGKLAGDLKSAPGARIFAIAGAGAALAHLFAATTLIVRRGFHGADMITELTDAAVETWTYSAAWALFGAISLGLGLMRGSPVLRWGGIVVLLATTMKVLLIDMAALDGVIRAASFLGLGAVLVAVALASRRIAPR